MGVYWKKRIKQAAVVAIGAAICVLFYFNKDLIQFYNLRNLPPDSIDNRLVPHRIDSIDQLRGTLNMGMRSAEVDVYFTSDDGRGRFTVGHDRDTAAGLTFEEYLSFAGRGRMKKLWMDIKNATGDNAGSLVSELNRLDSLFEIRDIAIVETSSNSEKLQLVSQAGYHLAYYLPTESIETLLKTGTPQMLEAEAVRLQVQLRDQQVSAITFDMRLYPFVKQYLEPLIPESTVYHTWGVVKMWEWGAVKRLEVSPVFNDSRVRTILFRVW
jgi:hypothetical protein